MLYDFKINFNPHLKMLNKFVRTNTNTRSKILNIMNCIPKNIHVSITI